jgi:hypothetical protein
MKRSVVGDQACEQSCAECAVRAHGICAALDPDELRQLEQLGHRLQYRPNEPVFSREEKRGARCACDGIEAMSISAPQKQRVRPQVTWVGSRKPASCIAYFQVVQARCSRCSAKSASMQPGK